MQSSVQRAVAFAILGTFAFAIPVLGPFVAVPFALIAIVGRVVSDGPVFELFAGPTDRMNGELRGLVGFALAIAAIALVASLTSLPASVAVAAVLLVAYGNLVEEVVCVANPSDFRRAVGFSLGGTVGAIGAQVAVIGVIGAAEMAPARIAFLAITGALVAALLRAVVNEDDPVVMLSVAMLLWLFVDLRVPVVPMDLAIAVGIAGTLGYVSWVLGTASVTGMLTGVIMSLLTIVLGGYGWFAVLIAFFGIGGLASKYRYEEKAAYGVAEGNAGARSGRNVLGNGAVALFAVIGFAASPRLSVDSLFFLFAFVGSVATAMGDTLSSEIGVLFGRPRLITTFERVETGTDGGVTIEGWLAGVGGTGLVAAIAWWLLGIGLTGLTAIVVAGVVGMTVDSLLGATLEGDLIGNQSVNFLATLAGALVGIAAVALGLV